MTAHTRPAGRAMLVGLAALAGLAIHLGAAPAALAQQDAAKPEAKRAVKQRTLYEDIQMFSGVLNQIRVNHPDTVDPHELIMAAIRGMLRAADPHSGIVQAMRFSEEKEKAWRSGKLYPVGVDFEYREGAPVVVGVRPGSSASRVDILPGDELVGVDGNPVTAESAFELEVMLSGAKNSPVRLTFERRRSDGTFVQLERTVKRERLEETTAVPTAFMLEPQTGYVRITSFDNGKVADDLHDALGRLEKHGMKRLVLDLRDNPGGRVDQATAVAGEFLPKGAIVYTQAGRKADIAKDTGRVERSFWSREKRYPIVVMINNGSASASELVTGALQDYDRALVVGRPSFGKSLVMQGFPLPDGSWVVMVFGTIKTPCGRVIQRQYHGLTEHEYRRRAGRVHDTSGRPSCKTTGGRTVYGGGGIYPDVVFPETELTPVWLSRVREEGLPVKWVGGHVSASGAAYASLDALAAAPTLAPGALDSFRRFAAEQHVPIPTGPDADRLLTRELLAEIGYAKWGDTGRYRLIATLDPDVRRATEAFGQAGEILKAN